jgi:glycosyltransferase involved in cell wall biosynthesis
MWDVYPDALKNAGISEKNCIYRIWATANRYHFRKAYRLYSIGESPASLMSKYVSKEKITIIPLWSGLRCAVPVEKEKNPFLTEHSLRGKFIVQYSGNIGSTHNIESLIEVARLTKDQGDIFYLFIGRGTKMSLVRELIFNYELDNCRLLPFQPDNIIKYSLAAADINVVLVGDYAAEVIVPSKVYNLLIVGSPLLCISPENSEVNRLITKYGVGENFSKNDYQGMVDFIKRMKGSPDAIKSYKEKALRASKNFTVANARKFYDSYVS